MHFSRRFTALILIITLSLAGCTRSTSVSKIESGKDITFFVTTDTHYLAKDLTDGGEAFQKFISSGDGRQLNYISEIMDAFTNDIRKKKPDILIISGDLTSNGEKESHLELAKKLKKIEGLGTAVYVIPGNHDILNPYARGFKGSEQYKTDYITEKEFNKIYGDFGYNEAISRDTNSLSYLAAPSKDVWLLMLDTAQYKNNISAGQPQGDGAINPGTFEWIKKCSDLAKKKHAQIIAVMHHNLMDHSETVNKGYTLNNSKDAIKLFESCGINLALTGHIHLQNIKSYKKAENTIYDIATAALGVYPQKYGILKYSPKNGYDYSTSRVDVEGWAKESGVADKNLISFERYSEAFFRNNAYNMTYKRLLIDDSYTIEEIKLMAETSALIRTKYFEGMGNFNKDEIINSQGFKLLIAAQSAGAQRNLMNMLNTDSAVNNKLHMPVNTR